MDLSKNIFAVCVAGALALLPRYAAASDPTESSIEANALTAKAAALYDEGVVAYKAGQWAAARASFLAAWSLKKHWQIAANLADCELQLGKPRDAAEHAAYYLRTAPADRRPRAQALLDKAQSKIAALVVRVDQPDAEVLVDGQAVGKAPLEDPVFVETGHHTVEAHLGPRFATVQVDALVGSTQPVVLSLKATDAAPVTPAEHRSAVPGIVLGGIAGAALVTGIALVGVAASKHATDTSLNQAITQAHHSCVARAANFDPQCSTLESSSSAADTLSRAGVGVLVGAGALAVSSVVYFVWPQATPRAPTTGGLHLMPTASTTGGGLLLSGAL